MSSVSAAGTALERKMAATDGRRFKQKESVLYEGALVCLNNGDEFFF
jgi:hypothetical protein